MILFFGKGANQYTEAMTEELKRIGEMLRHKRQEKGLSLKEVENATSVRQPFLAAIEDGSITENLAAIYAQGFLKQYAMFLGFEIDRLTKEFPAAFQPTPTRHDFVYGIGTLEARGGHGGSAKWLPNLLWAAISLAVLTAAWFLIKFLGLV